MGQIGNADEAPIWFDMPRNYTITEEGTKEVTIKTTGCEKQCAVNHSGWVQTALLLNLQEEDVSQNT